MSRVELILTGFGMSQVTPKFYKPTGKYPDGDGGDYKPQQEQTDARLDDTLPQQYSWLGTPIFANVELRDPSTGLSIVIDQVLCEVKMVKNIHKSKVQELHGTVKEFISNGDFNITMRGALFHINPQKYPINDMNTLVRILYVGNELDVVSDFLNLFKIYHVVVTEFRFPQKAGYQSMQLFEIKCLSDKPVQLKLDDEI
jgi:uncharacterized protein DUF6046